MGVLRRIDPPLTKDHICQLPNPGVTVAKTVVQCDECYGWHILDKTYDDGRYVGLGWCLVRWYDFGVWRRINRLLEDETRKKHQRPQGLTQTKE